MFQILICILSIHCSDKRNVFGLFHASFDFKRINSRFHKLRYILQSTNILQTQHIRAFLTAIYFIRQSAGLCTLTAISAAPSKHTAI